MADTYQKPTPREPKSASKLAQLQVQDRRREFLQRHPSYFGSTEHELADPILYERLVKNFQSVDERAAEKKSRGYGRTLEADLLRGEARLASIAPEGSRADGQEKPIIGLGLGVDNAWDQMAEDKAQGLELWHEFLAQRFIQGGDEDFDYSSVDRNEDYDAAARKDAEDAWFDDEEPSWVDGTSNTDADKPSRQGETGVQDF